MYTKHQLRQTQKRISPKIYKNTLKYFTRAEGTLIIYYITV